ncbi:protein of unknown function [Methylocella tundrae]|uniref:EF-hand domain-containing protein n=1 Tax=Methylocella tundrae TaxID=227605 RepID=A0A4U8Z2F7_METTU|nr:EF-hand domain-containing protein [Methylocella tundrae]VFU09594.1 protein of unknown function [Methylocella tundrae]
MIYRSVPTYAISDDELKPVSTPSDAFATELDFTRTIFLAAVDKNSKAPEIKVPGVDGYRGALSYALARALEGAADANGDGKITIEELFCLCPPADLSALRSTPDDRVCERAEARRQY